MNLKVYLSEVALLFLVGLTSTRGQESASFQFGKPFFASTASRGAKTISLTLPGSSDFHLNSSSTLDLRTSYAAMPEDAKLPQVSFVLLYANRSSTFVLSNATRSTSTPLCFEGPIGGVQEVTLVMSAAEEVELEFNLSVADLALPFGSAAEAEVTPGLPATYLVDPVAGGSMNDRYLLRVENTDNSTKDVCMIVTAYSNHCPYKNQVRTRMLLFLNTLS